MPKPWNDWYHCNGNTHGTWLLGDKRGSRTRHHRQHLECDYKNPPPPERDQWLRKRSIKLMKKPPTHLTAEQAKMAGAAMVRRLIDAEIELLSYSLDDHHFHLVARFPEHNPRYYIGLAKQRAAYLLVNHFELIAPVWAKRCQCKPIVDRKHQIRSVNYDIGHEERGAFYVWCLRDPIPEKIE